ncbi:MAG: hypothetical protein WCS87_19095 [Methylococcaceae bacterium]
MGKIEGLDCYFESPEDFKIMQTKCAFLEQAPVFDDFYGTTPQTVVDNLDQEKDVILEIDRQGVRRQLSCPVDRYVGQGWISTYLESTLVWKTYHSTPREFIYEYT